MYKLAYSYIRISQRTGSQRLCHRKKELAVQWYTNWSWCQCSNLFHCSNGQSEWSKYLSIPQVSSGKASFWERNRWRTGTSSTLESWSTGCPQKIWRERGRSNHTKIAERKKAPTTIISGKCLIFWSKSLATPLYSPVWYFNAYTASISINQYPYVYFVSLFLIRKGSYPLLSTPTDLWLLQNYSLLFFTF